MTMKSVGSSATSAGRAGLARWAAALPLFLACGCMQQKAPPGESLAAVVQRNQGRSAASESEGPPAAADTPTQSPPAATPAPADPPPNAARPQRPAGDAVAVVNGRTISRNDLVATLLDGYGLSVLQQYVALEAVRAAAQSAGVSVSDADIDREYDLTVSAADPGGTGTMTPDRREKLTDLWTRRTGVSAAELRLAMTRQAYLRKMVAPTVQISEEVLREEYDRQYGEKVEVRHIQLDSLRAYNEIASRLRAGDDFALLAARYSDNRGTAEDGGLLPPFSATDDRFPATLRQAAFKLKPGEHSKPVQYDNQYHVLKCERRLPGGLTPMALVRGKLTEQARDRLTREAMDRRSVDLLTRADLRINDAALRTAYQREQQSGRVVGPRTQ